MSFPLTGHFGKQQQRIDGRANGIFQLVMEERRQGLKVFGLSIAIGVEIADFKRKTIFVVRLRNVTNNAQGHSAALER